VKRAILLIALVLLAALGLAWRFLGRHSPPNPAPAAAFPDPRLTYDTPFRNVRPDVQYVGDRVCAECHADVAATFAKHPMGRSLAPESRIAATEPLGREFHNPFDVRGAVFSAERRGDQVFHKVTRPRPDGGEAYALEVEAAYVLGSGTRGRSYLVDHDGYLFQSPVSWFTQGQRWDLSPGFTPTQHFNRRVQPACLFCHCNEAEPVEDTVNRYKQPIFRGHAIGCERCHGPGDLHQKDPGRNAQGIDYSIVNPKHLAPALREAVCEQCHLQGESRIVRPGRDTWDFRPGMPLETFLSVLVRRPELTDRHRAVGHVEQMRVSCCFQKSAGKLGCASCHDPHELPTPEGRVAFYRDRCLICHGGSGQTPGCNLTLEERLRQNKEDSCIACHVPRMQSSDIVHTAVSDHRIPRKPPATPEHFEQPILVEGENPLVDFYRRSSEIEGPATGRDMGMALAELVRARGDEARPLARIALPLLEGVSSADVPGAEARAYVLWQAGRPREARAAYEALLEKAPRREVALADLAQLLMALADADAAVSYWKRAVDVNPWLPRYRLGLAQTLLNRRAWVEAREQAEAALRLNPATVEARMLLARVALGLGDAAQAQRDFEAALAVAPEREAELRRWFAQMKQ
jgi:hypothetical protein